MSTDTVKTKKTTLRTADKEEFEVDEAIAMEFGTVKSFLLENPESEDPIPLPNVSSECLSTIIEYFTSHLAFRGSSSEEDEAKAYHEQFVKAQDNESIKELILAANYLDIKDMLDELTQAAADRLKNKSVEYARRFFGVENDFSPEEEAALREEHKWAFEGVDPDED
ncbi:hypothetical protein PTKIN_Ptkin01aG0387600 [Pterospermum kingtungense]